MKKYKVRTSYHVDDVRIIEAEDETEAEGLALSETIDEFTGDVYFDTVEIKEIDITGAFTEEELKVMGEELSSHSLKEI